MPRLEAAAKAALAKVLAERPLPAEASLADMEHAALTAVSPLGLW